MYSQVLWGTLPMGWVLGGSWVPWSALPWLTPRPCLLIPRIGPTPQDAGGSVLRRLGAARLSPTVMSLYYQVWGSIPQWMDAVGPQRQWVLLDGLAFPGLPWSFPAKLLIKILLYFFPGWGCVFQGAMPQVGSTFMPLHG